VIEIKFYHAAFCQTKWLCSEVNESFSIILGKNWHKLRANIHKSLIGQFSGLAELYENWLYINHRNNDISMMPVALEVPNAHTA
jgi:hypothetical protein